MNLLQIPELLIFLLELLLVVGQPPPGLVLQPHTLPPLPLELLPDPLHLLRGDSLGELSRRELSDTVLELRVGGL